MNWKKRIDLITTLLAILISFFVMSRAFAGRMISSSPIERVQTGPQRDLLSAVVEWRISREHAWRRKMRTLGVLYEHQVTSELSASAMNAVALPARIAGQLADGDFVLKDSYADFYQFEAITGQDLRVESHSVRNLDVDTYLLLLDPDLLAHAENDDSGSVTADSRIETTLDKTGLWTLVVLSLEPTDSGDYTLRLE